MNPVDVLCWIVIGGAIIFVAWLGISCVIMASKYDKISEEQYDEYCRKAEKEAGDCDGSKMDVGEN